MTIPAAETGNLFQIVPAQAGLFIVGQYTSESLVKKFVRP